MMKFKKVGYSDGAVELTALHARPDMQPRAAVAVYPTFMNSTPNVEAKAAQLVEAGQPPKVLTAGAIVGDERATELFEAAYDEHARRLAKLYENLGND
mgnify:CR=1 FL=1